MARILPQALVLDAGQLQIVHTAWAAVTDQLLTFRFDEPAQDQLRMRQHAYLKGQHELLTELLNPLAADDARI